MTRLDKFKRRRLLMGYTPIVKEPVTYEIYNQGTSVNYGTFSTSKSGENSGAVITSKYGLQAYSGAASQEGMSIPLLPDGSWTGTGKWTVSVTGITEPGTLYITASRDTYSGDTSSYVSYEQKFRVLDSNGNTVMTQTPSTSSYTYSCAITAASSGFTVEGWVTGNQISSESIHLYVTALKYITSIDTSGSNDNSGNTDITTTPGTVLYGDGNTAEGEVWKLDGSDGSALEQDGILQILDNMTGWPWVTFLNKGRDIGFDFTNYSKLCIQTTRVTHQNEATRRYCYVSYSATNEQGFGDGYMVLTGHESGIVTDVVDISSVTSTNYIHIKGDDRVWISRVWLE